MKYLGIVPAQYLELGNHFYVNNGPYSAPELNAMGLLQVSTLALNPDLTMGSISGTPHPHHSHSSSFLSCNLNPTAVMTF